MRNQMAVEQLVFSMFKTGEGKLRLAAGAEVLQAAMLATQRARQRVLLHLAMAPFANPLGWKNSFRCFHLPG